MLGISKAFNACDDGANEPAMLPRRFPSDSAENHDEVCTRLDLYRLISTCIA